MLLAPPADGLVADLQTTAEFAIVQVLIKQLHRAEPALLQCHKVALEASWIAHGALDAVGANWFRYITRNSVETVLREWILANIAEAKFIQLTVSQSSSFFALFMFAIISVSPSSRYHE